MTNTVLLKRSSTPDSAPSTGQITYGELAINYNDGNLFYKNSSDQIKVIASNKFVSVTGNVTGGNVVSLGQVSATGNITGNYFFGNGSQLTGIATADAFNTIVVPGQGNVVANNTGVLNFAAGQNFSLITNPTTGTITFSAAGSSIFATGGDMGSVTEIVTASEDLGLISDSFTVAYDLGTLVVNGLIWPDQLKLPDYSASSLPTATPAGCLIFVFDAYGGSIPAFSDGSNWRRVDDRTIVS